MEIINMPDDVCYICLGHFKTKTIHKVSEDYGMVEVELLTSHKSCLKLTNKREKLKNQLLEIEYDIFMKQILD